MRWVGHVGHIKMSSFPWILAMLSFRVVKHVNVNVLPFYIAPYGLCPAIFQRIDRVRSYTTNYRQNWALPVVDLATRNGPSGLPIELRLHRILSAPLAPNSQAPRHVIFS